MLVLTRKLSEQIRVGDNVTITVLKVKGNTVRIGIEAPRDVRVVRGELPEFESVDGEEVSFSIVETPSEDAVSSQDETPSPARPSAPKALQAGGQTKRAVVLAGA